MYAVTITRDIIFLDEMNAEEEFAPAGSQAMVSVQEMVERSANEKVWISLPGAVPGYASRFVARVSRSAFSINQGW